MGLMNAASAVPAYACAPTLIQNLPSYTAISIQKDRFVMLPRHMQEQALEALGEEAFLSVHDPKLKSQPLISEVASTDSRETFLVKLCILGDSDGLDDDTYERWKNSRSVRVTYSEKDGVLQSEQRSLGGNPEIGSDVVYRVDLPTPLHAVVSKRPLIAD